MKISPAAVARRLKQEIDASDHSRNMVFFALEGILFNTMTQLSTSNNNLFATRLGATPFQLSLVTMLPQLVSMCILIPAAIFTDRMRSKRTMVLTALLLTGGAYLLTGLTPFLGAARLPAFLVLVALSAGPIAIYNSSWQAFFSDVVPMELRNRTLSIKNRCIFIVGFLMPLLSGNLLSSAQTVDDKIWLHQLLYWTAAVLLVLQVLVVRRVRGGVSQESPPAFSGAALKAALLGLMKNRRFLSFAGIALFFYVSWHLDSTLFYLGQIQYLESNEVWLAYSTAFTVLMQFLTIGFWTRVNEKHGVRFGIIFGALGLSLAPVALIVGTLLPHEIGRPVFVVSLAFSNFAFATVNLNILQCLLQVVDPRHKTLSIALYTIGVTLADAVSPVIAVQIYTALGENLRALHLTFGLMIVLRLVSAGLWALRWWRMRGEEK